MTIRAKEPFGRSRNESVVLPSFLCGCFKEQVTRWRRFTLLMPPLQTLRSQLAAGSVDVRSFFLADLVFDAEFGKNGCELLDALRR